jgi:hypothetical protein
MKFRSLLKPIFFLSFFLLNIESQSQNLPEKPLAPTKLFVYNAFNTIMNEYDLKEAFSKLSALKAGKQKKFTIVHIGDSHLQAGFFTEFFRKELQSFFGNAGRGIVFPYQLAKSNAPSDINSRSNNSWNYNRLTHPEINLLSGISGFMIQNNFPSSNVVFGLNNDASSKNTTFNKIKLFADLPDSMNWDIKTDDQVVSITKSAFNNNQCVSINLDSKVNHFEIITDSSTNSKTIYGIELENENDGLLYHTLAVNGAQYEQYNLSPNFWKQLPELQADLYILSLGTNEAQKLSFDGVRFKEVIDTFLLNIKSISPQASILITTVADNYKNQKPGNNEIRELNNFIVRYCDARGIPYWDLYKTMGGFGSSKKWNKFQYMSKDGIHFTSAGYIFQANLLYNAFSKSYNKYVNNN